MAVPIQSTTLPIADGAFDEVIDVRAPEEFAEDHISGAINLPVLNDAQRTLVGIMHKEQSPFAARRIGAGLVSAAIAKHLATHLADKPRGYRPLIYCWRGGQRSHSMATIMSAIGWPVSVLQGGYKAYRTHVREMLEILAPAFTYQVLNGLTGSGKTRILHALQSLDAQVLDLEGIANHKGSLFGGHLVSPQPSQKRFESLVFDQLRGFDATRPVWVEAESPKIGFLNIPRSLWKPLKESKVTEVITSTAARADHLFTDYQDWIAEPNRILATIDRLRSYHSKNTIESWKALCRQMAWKPLITELLEQHYDTRYGANGSGHYPIPTHRVELADQSAHCIMACARVLLPFDHTKRPE